MTTEDKPKRKVKAVAANSTMNVSREFKFPSGDDGERASKVEDTSEVVKEHVFDSTPAIVSIELGLTLNLGNYETAKISVGLQHPCAPSAIDSEFEKAKAWVEERVRKEALEIRSFSKSSR